ncbi:MAG: N-acetylmuramoyl-L-alanine amidase, partial [Psychromonas sp.]
MKLNARFFIRSLFLLTLCAAGFFTLASAAQTNQLKGVRAWPSPDNTRVVLDLSSKPDYNIHYLKRPDRVVIDLKSTTSRINLKKIINDGPLVNNLRESASNQKGTYRLVVDLNRASEAQIFTLPPEAPYGHRLVLDLPHQQSTRKPIVKPQAAQSVGRDIIIAIDAGHGGEDPGALGKYTYEKKITLEIAKRLKKRINQQNGMSAFLIRTGDYFVNLNKRSAIARKGKADFLVSVHADGFTSSRPYGASVWVLSNRRATTELGRWMEKHEAHSELLGGAGNLIQDSSSVPFLTEMFLDMSMGNAMDVGYNVGSLVVNELKQVTKLHKKRPVHASLAVLKSPDIPSILVEAGFITNRAEERLLNKPSHQNKIANAVFNGIYKHFTEAPPQQTLFAQKKRAIKHTVRGGESLSILAARYSVTTKELQEYNNLKSSSLAIGQVVKVPPNYQLVVKQDPVRQFASVPQKARVHQVKRGESLSVIASRYDTTTSALKKYNNLRSTSLAIGQKIQIPGGFIALAPQPKSDLLVIQLPSVHRVTRGESLSVIASRYHTTTDALKKHNKLRSTVLAVGQKIRIPGDAITPTPKTTVVVSKPPSVHRVTSGESLSVIANHYGTTTSALKKHNNLRSSSLAIGQKIKIPGDAAAESNADIVVSRQPSVHRVARGESLSVIASQYDTTMILLKKHNDLRSTVLAVGQKIKIPGDAVAESHADIAVTRLPSVHRVASGESLSVIASQYDTTMKLLKKHNDLRSTVLAVGQKIYIPGDGVAESNADIAVTRLPSVHRVASGESLSVIASQYGTTMDILKKHNDLRSTVLAVGQKIYIPGDVVASDPQVDIAVTKQPSVHRVASGESLSVIASHYDTTTNIL